MGQGYVKLNGWTYNYVYQNVGNVVIMTLPNYLKNT